MFIVLEGIDGSGTTTQAQKLCVALEKEGMQTVLTAEPTSRTIGKLVRTVLSGGVNISARALQMLFFADREDHLQTVIMPALKAGKIVISDRYFLSSIAYSSLSGNDELCKDISRYFLSPDLTLFLRVSPEIALSRIQKRGGVQEIFEKKDLLLKVAHAYEKNLPEKGVICFDTDTKNIEECAEDIWRVVRKGIVCLDDLFLP
jgi:dTMP kinase